MRMLILPAALLLGAALHALLPTLHVTLDGGLRALLHQAHRLFTTKRGRTDSKSALAVYLLGLAAAAVLVSALHPVAAALLMAPLFSGFRVLATAARAKAQLDSGAFAKDTAGYERLVLDACRPLGDAFAREITVPLLLCALGIPLHLSSALAWVYWGMRAAREAFPASEKPLSGIERAGDSLLVAFMLLCAGVVGRNPLRVGGRRAGEKLMHILDLEGESDHAPISGDISQGAFLCCLCAGLLCLLLTGAGFFFA